MLLWSETRASAPKGIGLPTRERSARVAVNAADALLALGVMINSCAPLAAVRAAMGNRGNGKERKEHHP
jgi:hypothetical protein